MEFTFTAIRAGQGRVTDRVQAETRDAAIQQLQAQGLVVLEVVGRRYEARPQKRSEPREHGRRGKRIKSEAIVMMSRQLAIMIESGVPIIEAIDGLAVNSDDPGLRDTLSRFRDNLNEGKGLSDSMSLFPNLFPPIYVSMVRTAEAGSNLADTLNRGADYLESVQEMQRRVKSAMTYPIVLMTVLVLVMLFMMIWVLPRFELLFQRMHAKLPASTQVLLSTSVFLKTNWILVPVGGVLGFFAIRLFLRSTFGKQMLIRTAMSLPVIGMMVKQVALARLLRSLGSMLSSGVSILQALDLASQSTQNYVYESALAVARSKVEEGVSLTQALNESGVIPATICQMVSVGEKSGRMSAVLLRVAQYYEAEVDAKLKALGSIIEPVMIVIIGIIVGGMAISIISPIYSMVDAVK